MPDQIRITYGDGVMIQASPGRVDRANDRLDQMVAAAERTGDHVWTALIGYHVADPAADRQTFDFESLVTGPWIGCYRCEQGYTAQLARRRCRGHG